MHYGKNFFYNTKNKEYEQPQDCKGTHAVTAAEPEDEG